MWSALFENLRCIWVWDKPSFRSVDWPAKIKELAFVFDWEGSQMQKVVATKHHGHNLKNQASSFAAIKACYPFTIKGELFSLLCYQPEAIPTSLKTLTLIVTVKCQCLPQIWNGQAKAQLLSRFILGRFSYTHGATCRSYRARGLPGGNYS